MKLIVAAATPIVVVLLGVVVSRAARRVEESQWANRKVIERRLELYDEMARPLNDLYCFFNLVGDFQEVKPPAAVARKRQLDKAFYVNKFLMGPEFGQRYEEFIDACFKTHTGPAEDAKLRESVVTQRRERQTWDDAWDKCFVARDEEITSVTTIRGRYHALMICFAAMTGVQSPGRGTDAEGGSHAPSGASATTGGI